MYYTLEDKLEDLKVNDLLRIYNSKKEYIFFDISSFNVGAVIKVVLTNNYEKYSNYIVNNWNGYDCIFENTSELYYTVEEILCKKYLSDDLNFAL